jgi:hypothetical protein
MNDFLQRPSMEEQIKKYKKVINILIGIICVLIFVMIIAKLVSKPEVLVQETEKKESLNEVSKELINYISDYEVDAIDAYGLDGIQRVAINYICTGVYDCKQIDGTEVKKYIKNVFNQSVELQSIKCNLNDGILYNYDANSNRFIYNDSHPAHHNLITKPIYTKVYSIKKDKDNYILTLNKLYYDSSQSDYITTEPSGINDIFDANNYLITANDKNNLDMVKLKANYNNNYSKLKNKGLRYRYTFVKKGTRYYIDKYEVLSE